MKSDLKTEKKAVDTRLILRMVALLLVLLPPFGLYASLEAGGTVVSILLFALIVVGMLIGAWV